VCTFADHLQVAPRQTLSFGAEELVLSIGRNSNATVILDPENTSQPDALLRRLPEPGGQTRVNEAGYLAAPPELIVQVASGFASIDLRDKQRAHCRNGAREYSPTPVTSSPGATRP